MSFEKPNEQTENKEDIEKVEPKSEVVPDCPYCGQVGGVSQYDEICENHGPAKGWVRNGEFIPAKKK